MEPHQPIGNGKTEALSLMAAAEALIHLAERLDEMREMLLGDADAGVADRDARAFRRGGDRDPDAPFGRRELERLLAEHCDINAANHAGQTALMMAALFGRTETVKLLMTHGADPSLMDAAGNTAVGLA